MQQTRKAEPEHEPGLLATMSTGYEGDTAAILLIWRT